MSARVRVALLGLVVVCGSGCAQWRQQGVARDLDRILGRLEKTGATYTARVVSLPDGHELYARDAGVPYTPASNMKVLTSAAALDLFGLERRFATYLVRDGDDLWIVGTGDPGFGDPRIAKRRDQSAVGVFEDWADALRARGMTRIPGDLVYYDAVLDDERTHPTWADSVLHWYGAPISGLSFNDNCVDFTVEPTAAGAPARLVVTPPAGSLSVSSECVTGAEHAPTIEKLRGGNIYKLGGTCATRAELKSKPVDDPGAFAADALRTHLAARGITIAGGTRRAELPPGGFGVCLPGLLALPPPADMTIAVYETTMVDILGRINTNSQNMFADTLCKLLGQAWAFTQGRHARGSWADGRLAIHAFLRRHGLDDRGVVVADGSGLSEDNRVTARLMTDLLAYMATRADWPVYRDSLAKGGINGTLEQRFAGYEGRVFAKTGFIGGVRALSGYAKTRRGEWLVFSIIYNGIPGEVEPYEALQDEAVKLLIESW